MHYQVLFILLLQILNRVQQLNAMNIEDSKLKPSQEKPAKHGLLRHHRSMNIYLKQNNFKERDLMRIIAEILKLKRENLSGVTQQIRLLDGSYACLQELKRIISKQIQMLKNHKTSFNKDFQQLVGPKVQHLLLLEYQQVQ